MSEVATKRPAINEHSTTIDLVPVPLDTWFRQGTPVMGGRETLLVPDQAGGLRPRAPISAHIIARADRRAMLLACLAPVIVMVGAPLITFIPGLPTTGISPVPMMTIAGGVAILAFVISVIAMEHLIGRAGFRWVPSWSARHITPEMREVMLTMNDEQLHNVLKALSVMDKDHCKQPRSRAEAETRQWLHDVGVPVPAEKKKST